MKSSHDVNPFGEVGIATRLLVSVRDLHEADAAVAGGADILDLKEPLQGALGRVSDRIARAVVERWSGHLPLSMALGELSDAAGDPPDLELLSHFEYLKIGSAGLGQSDWRKLWTDWRSRLPRASQAVLVVYVDDPVADSPEIGEMIRFASEQQVRFVLLDTYRKDHRRLTDCMSATRIAEIIRYLAECDIGVALAGRLNAPLIRELSGLHPSVIAVRSAVCGGDRMAAVQECAVRALKEQLLRWDTIRRKAAGYRPIDFEAPLTLE